MIVMGSCLSLSFLGVEFCVVYIGGELLKRDFGLFVSVAFGNWCD